MEVMVTRVKHSIKLTIDSFSTYIIILVYYVRSQTVEKYLLN